MFSVSHVLIQLDDLSVVIIRSKKARILLCQPEKPLSGVDRGQVVEDDGGKFIGLRAALTFIVTKEESLVLFDRAADCCAVLVLSERGIGSRQQRLRIELVVHAEVIRRAV